MLHQGRLSRIVRLSYSIYGFYCKHNRMAAMAQNMDEATFLYKQSVGLKPADWCKVCTEEPIVEGTITHFVWNTTNMSIEMQLEEIIKAMESQMGALSTPASTLNIGTCAASSRGIVHTPELGEAQLTSSKAGNKLVVLSHGLLTVCWTHCKKAPPILSSPLLLKRRPSERSTYPAACAARQSS